MSGWRKRPWPGFRSGARWKKIVAVLGYGTIALFLVGGLTGYAYSFVTALVGIAMVLLMADFRGIRSALPMLGSPSALTAAIGWVVVGLAGFGIVATASAVLPAPASTPRPSATGQARATSTLPIARSTASFGATVATSAPVIARQRAQVLSVTDGDTIRVSIDGKSTPVRYIGIDTPETVDPRKVVQCFGKEASAFNASLVAGKVVELEKDVSETDKYDRLLRYIWVDGKMVNEELVRAGYARSSSYPPDVKYQDRFRALEAEARAKGVGLWAANACAVVATPAPTRTAAPTVAPAAATLQPRTPTPALATSNPRAGCSPAYPDVCIPPPPPDLNCKDIPYRRFRVLPPDPHRFDGNRDGIGCES